MYIFLVLFLPLRHYPAFSSMDFHLPFYRTSTQYHGILPPVSSDDDYPQGGIVTSLPYCTPSYFWSLGTY